jgi:hypothetical protein
MQCLEQEMSTNDVWH